jgi:hypothetical protein
MYRKAGGDGPGVGGAAVIRPLKLRYPDYRDYLRFRWACFREGHQRRHVEPGGFSKGGGFDFCLRCGIKLVRRMTLAERRVLFTKTGKLCELIGHRTAIGTNSIFCPRCGRVSDYWDSSGPFGSRVTMYVRDGRTLFPPEVVDSEWRNIG